MPVLVRVDFHGDVTSVSPAIQFTRRVNQLPRKNLEEMITKPATKDGRAVASQFVMYMTLHASPTSDGKYDMQFGYVSASPVPAGEWHRVRNLDGHRLALVREMPRGLDGVYPNRSYYRNVVPA